MNLIQPGEQLVNMGSLPPVLIRCTSSDASSMMVRSALKLVSNTRWKPTRRSAATIWPSQSVPAGTPNSSARVTETAGACCTTTNLSGSRRAAITSGT